MLMACLVLQRCCFSHSLLGWKIDKWLYHCQPAYGSPHSYSRVCKMGRSLRGCSAQFVPVWIPSTCLPLSVGMCGNSYYDIPLPEMSSRPSPGSNLISAPFYGIQLAVYLNFTSEKIRKKGHSRHF